MSHTRSIAVRSAEDRSKFARRRKGRALGVAAIAVVAIGNAATGCGASTDDGGNSQIANDLGATSWIECANEGGHCAFTGTRQVQYGLNGHYVVKTFTNGVDCNNQTLGNDPLYGTAKKCWYAVDPATTWVACATEGGTCAFSGTHQVRYGQDGKYVYKSASGSIACTNAAFGNDPDYGTLKSCWYDGATPADAGADGHADTGTPPPPDAGKPPTPDASPPPSGGLSYLVGMKSGTDVTAASKAESWLGRPIDVVGATITTTNYIASGPFKTASGAYPLLEISFPLLSIFGENNNLSDLSKAAAGDYDSTYDSMATTIAGFQNPVLSARIGWEFNGSWYKWSKDQAPGATYANYVAAFQRAAAIIKKRNPHVLIQWCIAWGQPDPTPYWPGAYSPSNPGGVDVVSIDFYQANISQYANGGAKSTWAMAQSGTNNGPINVDWATNFAKTHGVKLALSEYAAGAPGSGGDGSGHGLDDGTWAAASIAWMNSLPTGFFLFANWSNDAPADDVIDNGANPAEQAALRSAWGSSKFGGTWWSGARPPSQ